MEIGSFFEINPIDNNLNRKKISTIWLDEVEKYGKRQVKYTASGREAIALAIRSFEKRNFGRSKVCLLPTYMCASVYHIFERAGWKVRFYHIKRNMAVNQEDLCMQVEYWKPDIIFVHPYYGVDTWSSTRCLLEKYKTEGICIVEDVTQSYYLKDVGLEADYVVGSLRKWYPIPDGGFIATDIDVSDEQLCMDETLAKMKLEAATLKWKYLKSNYFDENMKSAYLQKNGETEKWLDSCSKICMISRCSINILNSIKEEDSKKKRNENLKILKNAMRQSEQIRFVAFEMNEEQYAPLYAVVYVQDREEMQRYLSRNGIYAPALWPVEDFNRECLSDDESYIFKHILALPVDCRYGSAEMQYMADTMNRYKSKDCNREK